MSEITKAIEKLEYVKFFYDLLYEVCPRTVYRIEPLFTEYFLGLSGYNFKTTHQYGGYPFTGCLDTYYKGVLVNEILIKYGGYVEIREEYIRCLTELNNRISEKFVHSLPKGEGYFFPTGETT